MNDPCNVDSVVLAKPDAAARPPSSLSRRRFLGAATVGASALTCADFLGFFARHGLRADDRTDRLAADAAQAGHDPRYLVYWYLEGGWCGYDMFNPVLTSNNVVDRLDNISDERYRVLEWGEAGHTIHRTGNIRHGFLADDGADLFPDMAVLSSMHTGSGHSRDPRRSTRGR